jgi:hypothetical protein
VGVQEVRWEGGGAESVGEYTFLRKGEWELWIRYRFSCAWENHISS